MQVNARATGKEKAQHAEECRALVISFLGEQRIFIEYKHSHLTVKKVLTRPPMGWVFTCDLYKKLCICIRTNTISGH